MFRIALTPREHEIHASLFIGRSLICQSFGPTVESAIGQLVLDNYQIFKMEFDFIDPNGVKMTPFDGERIILPDKQYHKMMQLLGWSTQ